MISNKNIDLNEEGYLLDLNQWDKNVGIELAEAVGIEMTEKHWEVVNFLQDAHKNDVILSIRRIGKSGIVDIKGFYQLFPNGPLKTSSKIAGIPKPVCCI